MSWFLCQERLPELFTWCCNVQSTLEFCYCFEYGNNAIIIPDFTSQYLNILYLKDTTLNTYYFNLTTESMSKGYQTKEKKVTHRFLNPEKFVLKRLRIRNLSQNVCRSKIRLKTYVYGSENRLKTFTDPPMIRSSTCPMHTAESMVVLVKISGPI